MQSDIMNQSAHAAAWPSLPYEAWKETYATLHLWTQIVGKIRLASLPWTNHSWHVPLYVTARGLTTSRMPYGEQSFQIDFDFIDHRLLIMTADGAISTLDLRPRTVADFYRELFSKLAALGLDVEINTMPNEIAGAVPFEQDDVHASYDAQYVNRFWRALV